MATSSITLGYTGKVEEVITWDVFLSLFDTIWGAEARTLPKYPDVLGGVYARWIDGSGIEHKAEVLDEVEQAYQRQETYLICITGRRSFTDGSLAYWPGKKSVTFKVCAKDRATAEHYISAVHEIFPLTADYDIFISYASGDSALATELKTDMESQGLKCFMAERDIPVAADWEETIRLAILNSKRVLILLTPRSLDKPWVLMETGAAWVLKKELIPVLVQLTSSDLVEPLRRFQAHIIETSAQRASLVKELIGT